MKEAIAEQRYAMSARPSSDAIGVLASGGLDSAILVGHLLGERRRVQPFYVRTGLAWQSAEEAALERYLSAVATPDLLPLVKLEQPLADVYGEHWSVTGRGVPGAETPDEAVFLPGRNALLLVKAAVWCQLHGIGELALAPLGTSPFADAGEAFLHDFQAAINHGAPRQVRLVRSFGHMTKRQVMALGRDLPLEHTFSCIAPASGLHCGRCNKCAERRAAFADADRKDQTSYSDP